MSIEMDELFQFIEAMGEKYGIGNNHKWTIMEQVRFQYLNSDIKELLDG